MIVLGSICEKRAVRPRAQNLLGPREDVERGERVGVALPQLGQVSPRNQRSRGRRGKRKNSSQKRHTGQRQGLATQLQSPSRPGTACVNFKFNTDLCGFQVVNLWL